MDDREVEKILADVDSYKLPYQWSAKRAAELPGSLTGRRFYDGPCGWVVPLDTVGDG